MATILLIEDDGYIRSLLGDKLRLSGYEVKEAKDGKEGLARVQSEKPDLVLLDLLMPVMDGFEVLQTMKNDASYSGIPVIILSNVDQKTDLDRAMQLGAKDYLIKVYNTPDEIVQKIQTVLSSPSS